MEPGEIETERWVWYGGHIAADFVNTRRDRQASGVEYLREPDDLGRWLAAAGLVDGPVRVDDDALADAVRLREAIDAGIRATVDGQAFPPPALQTLNSWLAEGPQPTARLVLSDGVAELREADPVDGVRRALRRIAVESATLLGTAVRARLRICPGPACGGRFVDGSPARRRRWCSMAVCGNRAKAARHRDAVREEIA